MLKSQRSSVKAFFEHWRVQTEKAAKEDDIKNQFHLLGPYLEDHRAYLLRVAESGHDVVMVDSDKAKNYELAQSYEEKNEAVLS